MLQRNAKVVSIDGYEDVSPFDEMSLKKAVADQPVSVAIEAGGRAFQHYESVSFSRSLSRTVTFYKKKSENPSKKAQMQKFPRNLFILFWIFGFYRVFLLESADRHWTTVLLQLDMAQKMVWTTGLWGIPGAATGVKTDTWNCSVICWIQTLANAELQWRLLIPSRIPKTLLSLSLTAALEHRLYVLWLMGSEKKKKVIKVANNVV